MSAPRPSLRALLVLALPMVLARATQAVMTACDAAFAGPLGVDPQTAVTTGGINTYAFIILPMGTVFIVQSFAAQLLGRGDAGGARRFAWYGLAIAAIAGAVAAAAAPFIGGLLAFAYDGKLHDLMTDYIVIRLFSVAAVVGTEALGAFYAGLGNTWMQMIAGGVAMTSNVVLAWALIFGHLGAPALGVTGAAIATVIASWLGFAVMAIAFWRGWGLPRAAAPSAHRLTWGELGRVARFGLPNGFNWFLEFAAFQLFLNAVVPQLGEVPLNALMVVMAINSVSFMPAWGLASSGAVLAGQAIGAGEKDQVWPHVRLTLAATATWMVGVGALYLIAPRVVLGWFAPPDHHDELIRIGATMLVISAGWQLFDAAAMTFTEVLRAAGDTTWSAGARLVLAWAVFTPSAWIAIRVLGGGAAAAMGCLVGYLALLASALAWRFKSGAWRRIELIEPHLV